VEADMDHEHKHRKHQAPMTWRKTCSEEGKKERGETKIPMQLEKWPVDT
jgi:hypothetical protein